MEELEHLLIDVLGLPPNRVKVLLFVMKHKRATAKHICNELDMHQPVVSVVCNDLIEEDIFKAETESRKEGRGRKAYVYSLMASPQATMNKILMPKHQSLKEMQNALTKSILLARALNKQ